MSSVDKAMIKAAVHEAIDEKLGQFYIEREKHYQHHEFIDNVICYSNKIKGTACKTVTNLLIVGLATLAALGFGVWLKNHIKF
jgi:hypothetical protein